MGPEGTATTSPAGADNPREKRTCRICKEEKEVVPETWVYRRSKDTGRYHAEGTLCLVCDNRRKKEYRKRRDAIAHEVVATQQEAKSPSGKATSLAAAKKLDVQQALKAGSIAVNQLAPGVMARLMEYLEDPDHKHHMWAMDKLVDRILPLKLYQELGSEAAGGGGLGDRRPQFILNVLPASPERPTGQVYDQDGNLQIPVLPDAG